MPLILPVYHAGIMCMSINISADCVILCETTAVKPSLEWHILEIVDSASVLNWSLHTYSAKSPQFYRIQWFLRYLRLHAYPTMDAESTIA